MRIDLSCSRAYPFQWKFFIRNFPICDASLISLCWANDFANSINRIEISSKSFCFSLWDSFQLWASATSASRRPIRTLHSSSGWRLQLIFFTLVCFQRLPNQKVLIQNLLILVHSEVQYPNFNGFNLRSGTIWRVENKAVPILWNPKEPERTLDGMALVTSDWL